MQTKFKPGDNVKITFHPNKSNIGKIGIVIKVISAIDAPDFDTTGYYKVAIKGKNLVDYARDCDLDYIKESAI